MTNDQTPNSKKRKKLGFGAWDLGFQTSKEVGEAMILVKPKSVDDWASILYQTISQSNIINKNKAKFRTLAAKFS